ncbi:LuxR C-terminal-related transcriptional regulator [Sediminibacter sp. Hel_I_10]|uniref:LuxR C-terminal-related transcriptional regulator n=1 Tax=Sediminibacter sp. Hel_I_10 TaxID=1392490 RepID=UPI0004787B2E|nr:LuxR C-terminal-related transcriptional regulator [Sediminibacter sp. Hel_I_10]
MHNENVDLFKEVFETYKEYSGTVVETHIQKLRELDRFLPPMQSFFIVTNTSKQTYEFVSKNFEYTLGLSAERMLNEGVTYWFQNFHPDDLPIWMQVLEDFMKFTMLEVPFEERDRLSYTWNFRVRKSDGMYLNLIEHLNPTYFDESGKPIIGIAHINVVGGSEQRPIIGTIKKLNSQNEYETLYHKNYSQKLLSDSLTNREQDVTRLIALNNTSKQIGEKLFISPRTVDVHRRKILKKLDMDSTQELVQYCLINQFF